MPRNVVLVSSTVNTYDDAINQIIIQQIVTMPIYGKEALNICHAA